MFSSGNHHSKVPRARHENLEWRDYVLKRADESPEFREAIIRACSQDILFYINTFVWQHNPKKKGNEVGPFITWDFQEQALTGRDSGNPGLLWCIENGEDAVIEKSRDMGASWLCLIAFEWLWHFHNDKNFIVISRNEDAVDKPGTPSCLFWKLDHIHQYQPAWLMPKGWEKKKHRTDLQFVNPERGSVITGEASGSGKAGVGGRATAMFIDEFSQIKEDRETLHRTADTTDSRIFNGTHVGLGTAFYRLTVKKDIKHILMHWTQHPDKGEGSYHYDPATAQVVPHDKTFKYPADFKFLTNGKPNGGPFPGVRSPWYDKQVERRGSERDIAMDLDIDPRGSVTQFFDASEINELKAVAQEPLWQGDIECDRDTAEPKRLTETATGRLTLWCVPTPSGGLPVGRYSAGADIAWGTGATPSCFTLFNVDTGVKVLEYTDSRIKPENFAVRCTALCRLAKDVDGNTAMFAWEANGPGLQFGKTVMEAGYRRVYYRIAEFDLNAEASEKPGWFPSPASKLSLLSEYKSALLNREFANNSPLALDETLLFKYSDRGEIVHSEEASKDDPSGARVNHADRVIADALAWKAALSIGGRRTVEKPEDGGPPSNTMAWRRMLAEKLAKKARAWI